LAALALVGSGVVHGLWTDRWARAAAPTDLDRLNEVPLGLGEWQGQAIESHKPSPDAVVYLYRRYTNRAGETVTVALVGGRPGPISIHDPKACYGSSGYKVAQGATYPVPPEARGSAGEFRTAQFLKTRASETAHLRIYWAWNAGAAWETPRDPRTTFAGLPFLYKLYFIRDMPSPDQPDKDDPCVDLMRTLLPELQKAMFAKTS
jgi:hypothetical protein